MNALEMRSSNKLDFSGYRINFGPQHPAAHGVLRMIIELSGEEVRDIDSHIGLLHRGTEKLCENKSVIQGLPYWDRLDYVSTMTLEYTYTLGIEAILGISVPQVYKNIRVIFVELTRILNHLLAVTTHAMDVGALTPFLWGFEEREKIMEFYERVCGARLHANFIRPFGLSNNVSNEILLDIYEFVDNCKLRLDQIQEVLEGNRIWCERLTQVGILDIAKAFEFGCTGVLLRSTGSVFDNRKDCHLTNQDYKDYIFDVPVGSEGDCYDRFILRMAEMHQSILIIQQAISSTLKMNFDGERGRDIMKEYMETLIVHFKKMSEGILLSKEYVYMGVEAPKGEMGVLLVGNGTSNPVKMKIRAPGFFHLQSINTVCSQGLLADFVTVIGTLDLVLGEIDR